MKIFNGTVPENPYWILAENKADCEKIVYISVTQKELSELGLKATIFEAGQQSILSQMVEITDWEVDHIIKALKAHYKDEWCICCESVLQKLSEDKEVKE